MQAQATQIDRNINGRTWTIRRRIIYITLLFCAFCILYLMLNGTDESRLHETIVYSSFALAGAVIGSYVFGAVWDDSNIVNAKKTSIKPPEKDDNTSETLIGGTAAVDNPD